MSEYTNEKLGRDVPELYITLTATKLDIDDYQVLENVRKESVTTGLYSCGSHTCSFWSGANCTPVYKSCPANNEITKIAQNGLCEPVSFDCLCPVHGYTICGDPSSACSIGSTKGKCKKSATDLYCDIEIAGWNATSAGGSLTCYYAFDFNNFYMLRSFGELGTFLSNIYTKPNSSTMTTLPSDVKSFLRDTTFVYSVMLEYYNQIYSTGFYSDASNKGINDFLTTFNIYSDFNKEENHKKSVSENKIKTLGGVGDAYENGYETDFLNIIMDSLKFPEPYYENGQYGLTMYLSHFQYSEVGPQYIGDSPYLNKLLTNFLRDSEITITKTLDTTKQFPSSKPIVSIVSITQTYMKITDINNYKVVNDADPTAWTPARSDFAMTYNYKVKVDQWSPMLVLYFRIRNPTINYSLSVCDKIRKDAEVVPLKCMESACNSSNEDCKKMMSDNCGVSMKIPFSNIRASDYVLLSTSYNCKCYSSLLPPTGQPSIGNTTAMCFDKSCTSIDRDLYGLDNETCADECETMYGWLNSGNPILQTQSPQSVDEVRYEQICGKKYVPFRKTYNNQMLIIGITITTLSLLISFFYMKSRNYKQSSVILVSALVFIIIGGISTFLTLDFAGISKCEGNKNICITRLSSTSKKPIKIPLELCDYKSMCECVGDEDCPGSCHCFNGTCLPDFGIRKTKIIKTNNPQTVSIIASIIIAVLAPIAFVTMTQRFNWGFTKSAIIFLIVILSLIPLGYALYKNFKKYDVVVYDGPCQQQCLLEGQTCPIEDIPCCDGLECDGSECKPVCKIEGQNCDVDVLNDQCCGDLTCNPSTLKCD